MEWTLGTAVQYLGYLQHLPYDGQLRTHTSVHSNHVQRTTKVSAGFVFVQFSDFLEFLKSNNTVTEAKCRLSFIYLYISLYISQVTDYVCRTPVQVLPDGVVMHGGRGGHEEVPDGVGEGDDAVALEENHPQTVDQAAPGHLLKSVRVAHGCHH